MVQEVEGKLEIGDVILYNKTWKPPASPVAKLIFIHGFNDHINRYYELFPTLASRGIEVCGFDQRGWGRSVKKPSDRGLTGPTKTVIEDIVSFISVHLPSSIPVFVMGHSMGGNEALVLACDRNYAEIVGQIRGWILESPLIAFAKGSEPSRITIFFGSLAANLLPSKQLLSTVPTENLSRDPDVVQSLANDPLLHGYGTLEGLSGMLERVGDLTGGKISLNKSVQSVWIGHGNEDKVTSYEASKKWFEENCTDIKDKEFKTYEGCYHQLHADLQEERLLFAEDVANWILNRLRSGTKL
ncbi:putative monoglyceride lipase [Golovinomyces cichoracearum]|uniref:Putative monoglyceride lipase n=1 Tax=Golovinomyces cichoracearum TaxID=62708 RepID=A0A420ILY8_9PEZI|nr:putative monoglyceride lipase [Golovinomyces cichoracearum]